MTVYISSAQRGIASIGGAGTGKTFSTIDPLIRSSLDQGFPTIVYDFKYPAQTKRIFAYALKRGYSVNVFAPGYAESDICNPLDFLKNAEDGVAAAQLIEVISKNTDKSHGKATGDKFFDEAGDTLVEGIFLVTKAVEKLALGIVDNPADYCDLMMAVSILDLPGLPKRLEAAINRGDLDVWTARPLAQLISVKDASKTVSGIVGNAQRMFQRFMKKDFLGAFCGQTNLTLDLDGKQLLIFGVDRNNRDIVGPLLTAILHMVVSRNISREIPRATPLLVSLDELPTLYLPHLANWLNEGREDGFCGLIAFQNLAQIEKIYGKEMVRIIVGGCATKFLFNPQDPDSAKFYSEIFGECDVQYRTSSRTTGSKGNRSKSSNQNLQKKQLYETAQFLKLGTGCAVMVNPDYTRGDESYIPIKQKFRIPRADILEQEWSESRFSYIREYLISNNSHLIDPQTRTEQFRARQLLANRLFPMPNTEPEEITDQQSSNEQTPPPLSSEISAQIQNPQPIQSIPETASTEEEPLNALF